MSQNFDLRKYDITVSEIHRNLPPSALYEHAIRYDKGSSIAENGALVAYSGVKTGRSPKDKRVVKHRDSESEIWWGSVNIPLDEHAFAINCERARDYLNTRERLSTALQVGTQSTGSKCASSARDLTTRCSCIRCSSGRQSRNSHRLVNPTLSFVMPANSRPTA
jgi:ATP-dependent phosphoenolpyruvate carboxykinase